MQDGTSALHAAVGTGNIQFVNALLDEIRKLDLDTKRFIFATTISEVINVFKTLNQTQKYLRSVLVSLRFSE